MEDLICADWLKRTQGIYVERYESLFKLAKAVEADAVAALKQHSKEHGCWVVGPLLGSGSV